jgi:MFS family permease
MTANASTAPEQAADTPQPCPVPGANLALALLIVINLFNYIDRQVLAAVEPEIRKELFPDNPDSRLAMARMGWLSSAFLVTYMIAAPIFGFLAERMPRWWLIGIGVLLWTAASGGSGARWGTDLALAFWLLFLTRCCVGIGEAVYGPVAPTVLSDLYPIKQRGRVMAWFYMAIPVGGALGYTLGDVVLKNLHLEWRWAFYLVVPPGVVLGLWCFFMREPPAGGCDGVQASGRRAQWKDYLTLARTPSYVLNTLGMTGMTFAIGGLAFWMPA